MCTNLRIYFLISEKKLHLKVERQRAGFSIFQWFGMFSERKRKSNRNFNLRTVIHRKCDSSKNIQAKIDYINNNYREEN
jgi:hypothetical protein